MLPEEWESAKESALDLARSIELAYCLIHTRGKWVRTDMEPLLHELSTRRSRFQELCERSPECLRPTDPPVNDESVCELLLLWCSEVEKNLAAIMAEERAVRSSAREFRTRPTRGLGWL